MQFQFLVESLFWGDNSPIQYAIEMSYKTTSEKVLKVLIDDSNLLVHLKAIKKYLLLGQGDFIQYFLELIQYARFLEILKWVGFLKAEFHVVYLWFFQG